MAKRRKRRRKLKLPPGLFGKIAVVVIIVQVFLYTWVHLIMSYMVGIEIAPTVSCAFYAFCGAEAGLLAWIKNTKNKNKESEESENERTDFSETDQP
jgi:hypothetical protein